MRSFFLITISIFLTACGAASATAVAPTAALTATATALPPTATEAATKIPVSPTPEKHVSSESEAAKAGIPIGAELGSDNIYRMNTPTGILVVGKIENGAVKAEAFLSQKIYSTPEEALEHPWNVDVVLANGCGKLAKLTAQPLPDDVVSRGTDIGVPDNEFIGEFITPSGTNHMLRWASPDIYKYFDTHPEDQPQLVGYCARHSSEPGDISQPDYIVKIIHFKSNGRDIFLSFMWDKAKFDEIRPKVPENYHWPIYVPAEVDTSQWGKTLAVKVIKDKAITDLIMQWKNSGSIPEGLENTVMVGATKNVKPK